MIPAIFGLSTTSLLDTERGFFREAEPAGYIIFRRNIENRRQLRKLTDDLRSLHGMDNLPILIDQEGGRVARMAAPEWPPFPAGEVFDNLYDRAPASAIQAARLNGMALAMILAEVGISVNCLPLLDLRRSETSEVIGDRALGSEPQRIAALGRALLQGMAAKGVVGVVKHIPGHGRATQDTHLSPAIVTASDSDLAEDLRPFATLRDAAMAMTCHVIFHAWDSTQPATLSSYIVQNIIRERVGFGGLLMSDDLEMKALDGDLASLAEHCIVAGCDIALHCSGDFANMTAIAERLSEINPTSRTRLENAMSRISTNLANRDVADMSNTNDMSDFDAILAERDALLAIQR